MATFISEEILSEGGITGTTISGGTFFGDGSNLTGISAGGTFTGGTVTGNTIFTQGVTANTFSGNSIVVNTVDSVSRVLQESNGDSRIHWGDGYLYNVGVIKLDWNNSFLYDSSSNLTLDWENTILTDPSNGSPSLVWKDRILSDNSNTTVLNWQNKIMSGMTNIQSSIVSATTYLNLTTGNLATVQARRTTGFSLPASFSLITLDATDVENDPTVIAHDNVNTERIYVYSTGLYLIHYHADVGPGTVNDFEFSVLKNALTTIDGSLIAGKSSSTDKIAAGVDVLVLLNANEYVSLYGRYVGSSGGIANNVVLSVTKLEGVVGPQGNTGAQGPTGIGLFTGGTITGDTNFTGGLSATTLNFTTTPTNNNANTQILTRNSTTGEVEYRADSSITGGVNSGIVYAFANNYLLT